MSRPDIPEPKRESGGKSMFLQSLANSRHTARIILKQRARVIRRNRSINAQSMRSFELMVFIDAIQGGVSLNVEMPLDWADLQHTDIDSQDDVPLAMVALSARTANRALPLILCALPLTLRASPADVASP